MKARYLFLFIFVSECSFANKDYPGKICHAENAPYNYGGVLEFNTFGQLICNYWQFLDDEERHQIEQSLNIYGEPVPELVESWNWNEEADAEDNVVEEYEE